MHKVANNHPYFEFLSAERCILPNKPDRREQKLKEVQMVVHKHKQDSGSYNVTEERFIEMNETSFLLQNELNNYFIPVLAEFVPVQTSVFMAYCTNYLNKKISNKPLRAYFTRKVYEYILSISLKDDKTKFKTVFRYNALSVKLSLVFEVIIVIQYLHNHILDEKYDTKAEHHKMVVKKLISSNILRETLFIYLDRFLKPCFIELEPYENLVQRLRKLFLYVDLGQYMDKEYNTYKKWKDPNFPETTPVISIWDDEVEQCIRPFIKQVQDEVPGKAEFIEGYFRRVYLSNVYFFRCISESISDLLTSDEQERLNLTHFSIYYGYMLQVINDYADFAYSSDKEEREKLRTSAKNTTDIFADLYNFNVTLPLIYHLSGGGRQLIEGYLEGGRKRKKLLSLYPQQIMQEIIQSGSIHSSIRISRQLATSAKATLNKTNPVTPFLMDMCDIAYKNKFYQIFK
jgi:geranylgeranyl pyrophosphate synthase